MHTRQLPTAIVALMLLTTLAAIAQDQGQAPRGQFDPEAWFAHCDANADGKVTRDEFRGNDAMFARLDANEDDAITKDELAAAQGDAGPAQGRDQGDPAQRWQMMKQRFDADGDGQISAAEFQGPERVFTLLDQDGDGVLTEEEAGRAGAQGEGGAQAGGRRALDFATLLQNADKDGDGKISREEWPARAEMFDRLDGDADGLLTAEEGAQLQQQMAGQRAERIDPGQIFIRMLDKNGDGQVSNSEWTEWFGGADENEDGLLSHAELTKKLQETMRPAPQPAVEE